MKKCLAFMMVFVLMTGILASCSSDAKKNSSQSQKSEETSTSSNASKDEGTAEDAKPITIQFWNSWTGPDGDTLVDIVKTFNESNPWNITIEMDINSAFAEKLATALPAGESSELMLMGTGDRFKYQEYLYPMDDVWSKTQLKEDDFLGGYLEACKIDDKLYSIPFQNSSMYMYWNKDLFEKAGLDPESPPKSLKEWTEVASKITDASANVYGSGLFKAYGNQLMSIMQLSGGMAVTEDSAGKYKVNFAGNDGYKEFLTWAKALVDAGDQPLEDDIDSMFKANQIGVMTNGAWLAPGATDSGVNYGMTKIFGSEPMGDVAGFFISDSASEEAKLACMRFIEWWYMGDGNMEMSKTGGGRWALEIGFPSSYLPLINSDEYKANDRLKELTVEDTDAVIQISVPTSFYAFGEVTTIIGNLVQAILYDTPIDDALATAQQEAEAIVVQYHGEDALVK